MVGKSSLIIILGFSIIFGVAGRYWNRTSNKATQNLVGYYDTTMAHNIAVSAANIACDTVFSGGCKDTLSGSMPSGNFSGGNENTSSGSYATSAVRLSYGGTDYLLATAVGNYNSMHGTISDTVRILFQPSFFSGYAFFTQNENNVNWITGDTVYGPFHTNGNMYITGSPVFYGRATWVGSPAKPNSSGSRPYFYGGWQQGAATYVQIPADINGLASAPTATRFTGSSSYTGSSYAYDVCLTFNFDGAVTETDTRRGYASTHWHSSWSTVASTPSQNIPLSSIADPYGQVLIVVQDGDVHVSGTLKGNVTVAALQGSGSSRISYTGKTEGTSYFGSSDGNVIIDGNMTHNSRTSDMLGLVADNSVALNNQPTAGKVEIDGAIFARKGSFSYLGYATDHGSTSNGTYNTFYGHLDVFGSITQNLRGAVGQFGSYSGATGYLKNYRFDNRFYTKHPPYFPAAPNRFRIVSWGE